MEFIKKEELNLIKSLNKQGIIPIEINCKKCNNNFNFNITKKNLIKYITSSNYKIPSYCDDCTKIIIDEKTVIIKNNKSPIIIDDNTKYFSRVVRDGRKFNYDENKLKILLDKEYDIIQLKSKLKELIYNNFLLTNYWRLISKYLRLNNKCKNCGSISKLVVHHKSYENHGDEINHLNDLVVLCEKCHNRFHKENPKFYSGYSKPKKFKKPSIVELQSTEPVYKPRQPRPITDVEKDYIENYQKYDLDVN